MTKKSKKNDYKGVEKTEKREKTGIKRNMIVINCTGSDTIELHQLTEFQGELKERSAGDIEKIIKSIRKHGFSFPFFVWAHAGENGNYINHVLDGHGRLEALKKLQSEGEEIPPLPCVYVSAENEAEAKEKLLKLNSQYGHMTAESVAQFLDGLQIDFDELQLPDGVLDLTKLEPEETKDDDNAPDVRPDEVADSERGQLYRLGRHYLFCGDSTNADDMRELMGDVKADLIVTDPPYNVDYEGKTAEALKIEKDNMNDAEFKEFLKNAFTTMLDQLKRGGGVLYMARRLKGRYFQRGAAGGRRAITPMFDMGKKRNDTRTPGLAVATRTLPIWLEERRKPLLGRPAGSNDSIRRETRIQENEQRPAARRNSEIAGRQHTKHNNIRGQAGEKRGTPDHETGALIPKINKKQQQRGRRNTRPVRRIRHNDNCGRETKPHGLRYGIGSALLRRNTQTLDSMGGRKRQERRQRGA